MEERFIHIVKSPCKLTIVYIPAQTGWGGGGGEECVALVVTGMG